MRQSIVGGAIDGRNTASFRSHLGFGAARIENPHAGIVIEFLSTIEPDVGRFVARPRSAHERRVRKARRADGRKGMIHFALGCMHPAANDGHLPDSGLGSFLGLARHQSLD